MKKLKSLALYSAMAVFALTSCDDEKKDDDTKTPVDTSGMVSKSGTITADEHWTADKVYLLDGRVTVTDGATLTIDPGTIIKANPGAGAVSSALLISRNGMINAVGTPDKPIIFTTIADDIEPGQIISPNMDAENNGLWGGVIILGKAKISASSDAGADLVETQIEGIPTSDQNGLYGGTDDAHNSGKFKYVSIRHGGTNIGSGNEINGLTLGGVGSATEISNIEIVANQDDGVEWFGGTVSVSNVLVWNSGDDGIDTDQAWSGELNDFVVINSTGSCFELDGPEGTYTTPNHVIKNGTVNVGDAELLIDFDANTDVDMSNIYFYNITGDHQVVTEYADLATGTAANIQTTLPAGYVLGDVFVGMTGVVTEVAQGANTVGHSGDYSWTWASKAGAL